MQHNGIPISITIPYKQVPKNFFKTNPFSGWTRVGAILVNSSKNNTAHINLIIEVYRLLSQVGMIFVTFKLKFISPITKSLGIDNSSEL